MVDSGPGGSAEMGERKLKALDKSNVPPRGANIIHACQILMAAAVLALAASLFSGAPAQAGCDFRSFWSGGCNKEIEKALTPPPPSK
jgi:hypothetical protein